MTDPNDALSHLLLPALPLRDGCLFPEASLTLLITDPNAVRAVEMAERSHLPLLALAQRETDGPPPGLHATGTLAAMLSNEARPGGRLVGLDGLRRARALSFVLGPPVIAEAELLADGDPGDDWGGAVEALARYLHAHPELRAFLDQQRRSKEPMSWVNLACQHLPIAATARQRLLEADARERCLKISRGLDALLRKEQIA
ncbi:MAG TPA: LON peptidase substrate-binding domain-containing protein [Vicinamibacteria bacterium]|nr:LON peptidase substrate-binding domain-containing protein [Vicinamibacteria bacterium]